ncbi:hypothetical protein KC734_01860 [candidate division KSB1 bacterium]|nr:hypothetical protein [candidate division KSB1 bacterium]
MKELHDIEQMLRDSRLPDSDFSKNRSEAWRRLIDAQRRRRKTRLLFSVSPWVWALASLVLVLLCLMLMLWLR